MKESYDDFKTRIKYQDDEQFTAEGRFDPNGELSEKVAPDGRFCPFYGDTVVFELDDDVKARVAAMIEKLYEAAPECFCEKLVASTVHMTMHDLSAPVSKQVTAVNEKKLKEVLRADSVRRQIIRMKSNKVINMVGKSLLLTLLPADREDWDKLQEIYTLIDRVKVCDYPFLTPHITLGYYRLQGFDNAARLKLKAVIDELNLDSFDVTLSTDRLYYQHFTDMNHYENIFAIGEAAP